MFAPHWERVDAGADPSPAWWNIGMMTYATVAVVVVFVVGELIRTYPSPAVSSLI